MGSFNPRTHEGCDIKLYPLGCYTHVSIHAPTRGATSADSRGCILVGVSIHAPTRGATSVVNLGGSASGGFNPRTHEGCDLVNIKKRVADMFQSTHPRGVRLAATKAELQKLDVSIHAPTRGATPTNQPYP